MRPAPLDGVKVLEAATLFAGPLAATFLGDFGADVTKIEHPARPDAARTHGASKDGIGLWFKTLGRNKRLAILDLSRGRDVFLELVCSDDVLRGWSRSHSVRRICPVPWAWTGRRVGVGPWAAGVGVAGGRSGGADDVGVPARERS